MGVWRGARVAVKVREYTEPDDADGTDGASSCGGELSGLLSDLGSDASALSAALSARAGTPHIGSSSAASSFGNAPLVEALLSRWARGSEARAGPGQPASRLRCPPFGRPAERGPASHPAARPAGS